MEISSIQSMKDSFNREIDYMRISITDRCNLRCRYCLPEGVELVDRKEILSLEEIVHVCEIAAELGIKKIKITGGEPLVRGDCCELIKKIKQVKGIEKVTITTNGLLLEQYAQGLIDAGIDAINISLDTMDKQMFEQLTQYDQFENVLKGIDYVLKYNIPIKINAVSLDLYEYGKKVGIEVKKDYWKDLIDIAKDKPIDVRFIEIMPIGFGKYYETIDHKQFLEKLKETYPSLKEDHRVHGNGPAVYYQIEGYKGSIGLISAIHGKFCDSCNRIRLTSQGYVKPCLCYNDGVDLKSLLRSEDPNKEIMLKEAFKQAVLSKPNAHSFETMNRITETKGMSSIGG